ncbi:zinc-dependent metalloprotease [Rhodohalobacter mucosus]|uniref:Zinc-dependent metalloprotease n=1 Tax=Rhodohalobacter mucosus TaxID=2079485 RepID=A0A316TMJ1_9BACT|nr:zinc-dependent metalloprotease [Rhodohalobacter mucosus]PWN05817.1 zinc-dependent metalloprotease [Rhodohalobacter mucosus]
MRRTKLLYILLLPAFFAISCKSAESVSERPSSQRSAESSNDYSTITGGDAVSADGVVDIHYKDDKIYYEIPDSLFGRDFLMVSRVASVPSNFFGFTSSGSKTAEQVVIFEKVRDKVTLRQRSYNAVAADSLPISRSVRANNFEPVIATFDIQATNPETGASVIEINPLFETDVPAISGMQGWLRSRYQVRRLDTGRSYIDTVRTFPLNVEARHVMTYEAMNPPSASGTNTISLLMNQSMVLLPKEPMKPRHHDYRVGWFTVNQLDFNSDAQKADTRSLIRRWRLEPSDPEAYFRGELVEPVKPIVYYVDPGTPEEYREAVIQGVEDWNVAFEEAGFKNAIQAKLPPTEEEDPNFEPEDIRYNMVRWIANTTRNATGPSTTDPRTGEIIASDIIWYHNHIRSYRNRLMLETGAANPDARSLPIDNDYLMEAIRQVIAHEIGHAIGLPHNMKANSSYPVDSLRSPSFTAEYGVSASVMDYARQNYIAQPGDGVERFIRKIGPYDKYAVNWGYRIIPGAETPEEEIPTLREWIMEKANDPMYRFGTSTGYDPSAQTEALSDDPVQASTYGMMNLQRVIPNLIEWTSRPGRNYEDLEEIYGELIGQWNRYVNHVITNIGGVYVERITTDQEGDVFRPVSREYQQKAMQFMIDNAFSTPDWLLNAEILRNIEHAGAIERIQNLQGRQLANVMSTSRMIRLIEDEAFRGDEAYAPAEMLEDLRNGIWSELSTGDSIDVYRRNLQRVYIHLVGQTMESEDELAVGSDIKAMLRAELNELQDLVEGAADGSSDRATRVHLNDVKERIADILEG